MDIFIIVVVHDRKVIIHMHMKECLHAMLVSECAS